MQTLRSAHHHEARLITLVCLAIHSAVAYGNTVASCDGVITVVPPPETQAPDTLTRTISEVTVSGRLHVLDAVRPQSITASELRRASAHSVADAVRWMSGVQLKDYGGLGGLKTVNLRSMGTHHVGVYYDGMEMGNAQNGVVDLGQLSLDNVAEVSVYHGQRASLMQSAREHAGAGTLMIATLNPLTAHTPLPTLRTRLQYGSASTARASLLYTHRLNAHTALTVNVEGTSSDGHYPFTYRRRALDGTLAYDTTAVRQNGDVQCLRFEANAYGTRPHAEWQAKAYGMMAERGIPGAIVNNVWRRGERQSDGTLLLQGHYTHSLPTHGWTLKGAASYAHYRTHYTNRDTTTLMIDNTYRQQAWRLSGVAMHNLTRRLSHSLSLDLSLDHLTSDRRTLTHRPLRVRSDVAKAIGYESPRLRTVLSAVWTHVWDRQPADSSSSHDRVALAWVGNLDLTPILSLRAHAKTGYRMPTFNDLYYTDMGNALLKPEYSYQYSIGCDLAQPHSPHAAGTGQSHHSLHIDAYYNRIADKIVAYPKGQQFRWTMLNLGRVDIWGIEVRSQSQWQCSPHLTLAARLQYTLQSATDRTDRSTSYYGHQIPYVPWHSGSAVVSAEWRQWSLGVNWIYTGQRYCQQENIAYNHLQPWYTTDLTLATRWHRWHATLEIRNLLDQQYDVIINYPMPGCNYLFTLQCDI